MSGISQDNRNILSGILCIANLIIMIYLFPIFFFTAIFIGLLGIIVGIIFVLIQLFPIYSVFRCVSQKKPVFLKGKTVDNPLGEMLISEPIELKPVFVIAFVGFLNIFGIIGLLAFMSSTSIVLWVLNIMFSIIAGIIYKPYKDKS